MTCGGISKIIIIDIPEGRIFWINIAIFFISAAISYIYEAKQFNTKIKHCKTQKKSFAILCVIALMFVIFTFSTPEIGIFKDPLTGAYGI